MAYQRLGRGPRKYVTPHIGHHIPQDPIPMLSALKMVLKTVWYPRLECIKFRLSPPRILTENNISTPRIDNILRNIVKTLEPTQLLMAHL
jgi:hypothetical protein